MKVNLLLPKMIEFLDNVQSKVKHFISKKSPKFKRLLFGIKGSEGFLYKLFIYFIAISFSIVFLYPLFFMFVISMMSNTDLVDSTIQWLPSSLYLDNYKFAIRGLNLQTSYVTHLINLFKSGLLFKNLVETIKFLLMFGLLLSIPITFYLNRNQRKKALINSAITGIIFIILLVLPIAYFDTMFIAGSTTILIAIASSIIGYGLARFDFKLKKTVLVLMLLTYILPKALLFIPRFDLYGMLKIKGNIFALWLPALLGQGEQAAFFILIFYQFFKMIPIQLEEAGTIDGAGPFRIFLQITLPMATPAFIITLTYGFAVNWNEMFYTNALAGQRTIPMLLQGLQTSGGYDAIINNGNPANVSFTESKAFAGSLLSVFPLVVIYGFIQRWFVESIDKSGLTGM